MLKKIKNTASLKAVALVMLITFLMVPVVLSCARAEPVAKPAPKSNSTSSPIPGLTPPPTATIAPSTTVPAVPSATTAKPPAAAKAKLITPAVTGETVSVSLNEVQRDWNTRFVMKTADGDTTFMAYQYGGKTYVRASVCPPCRSLSFTLKGGQLVCDACGTTFAAATGKGIGGACVNYPKAPVAYQLTDGNVVMQKSDLLNAFIETIQPG